MFKAIISLVAVLALGLGASTASALIVSDNFESYTGSGGGTDFPSQAGSDWSFFYNTGASNNIVSEGGTHGNVLTLDTTGQGAFVPNFDWSPYGAPLAPYGGEYANGGTMAFDIRLNAPIATFYDLSGFNGPGLTPIVVLASNGGTGATLQALSTNSPLLVTMTVGTWYTIWIQEPAGDTNTAGDVVNYYVDKNLVASDTDPYLGGPAYGPDFGMSGNGASDNISFDNIEWSATPGEIVPEPASMGLLAMGGLLLLKRSRA